MNKVLHSVVLVVFCGACWFLSVPPGQAVLPAFTRLCMGAGPVLLAVFILLALGYCIYVWVHKAGRPASWIGFLATAMSALVLVLLPTVVAIYIPLVDFLNRSTTALPK